MNKSESIKSLATALAKAQGEFKAVPMNSTNPFLKNRYADLGAVIETAKPIMAANGLAVTQLVGGDGVTISVTTMLMHVSGEWIESTVSITSAEERGKSSAQVAGSIVTYLRRYALASVLGLYADEDADGNHPQAKDEPAKSTPVAALPLEAAVKVTTSEGKPYKDMDDKTLIAVEKGLDKAIAAETDPQRIDELKYKKAAAQAILKSRKVA